MTNVYFIRCQGYVKIGQSHNVEARLAELQTGNPHQLQLAAIIPEASELLEGLFHAAFLADRHNGEWFRMSATLRKVVILIRRGARPRTLPEIEVLKNFATPGGIGRDGCGVFDSGARKVVGLRSRMT